MWALGGLHMKRRVLTTAASAMAEAAVVPRRIHRRLRSLLGVRHQARPRQVQNLWAAREWTEATLRQPVSSAPAIVARLRRLVPRSRLGLWQGRCR